VRGANVPISSREMAFEADAGGDQYKAIFWMLSAIRDELREIRKRLDEKDPA
jgi:hypothetical protein